MRQSDEQIGRLHFPTTNDSHRGGGEKTRSSRTKNTNDGMNEIPKHNYWWDERSLTNSNKQQNLYYNQFKLSATIDLDCDYVRNLVIAAFKRRSEVWEIQILNDKEKDDQPNQLSRNSEFFWGEYERIHWDKIMDGEQFTGCYCVRKGLIRKAHLAFNITKWISKRGKNGILAQNVPLTFILDIPDMDYFEEAMSDLPEIRGIYLYENRKQPVQTWIAKPSIINQANAIFIFKNEQQLKENLSLYPDLREWVIQEYIEPPLLIKSRKFHIRTYVLCVGNLDVFVYKNMLALFASEKYYDENDSNSSLENGKNQNNYQNLNSHLTNTCRVEGKVDEDEIVFLLNEIDFQKETKQREKLNHQNDYGYNNSKINPNQKQNWDSSRNNIQKDSNINWNKQFQQQSNGIYDSNHSNSNTNGNDQIFQNNCQNSNGSQNFSLKNQLNGIYSQSQIQNCFSLEQIHDQIFKIVGECFECIGSELTFQALPNAFELFGFDFMLSEDGRVWLLEANAEPDLKQTGCRLKGCMEGLIEGIMRLAVDKFGMQMGYWDGRVEPSGIGEQWVKVYSRESQ